MAWSISGLLPCRYAPMEIKSSEMPLQADGSVYHLNLHPEEIAENILLVGDPGRVAVVSSRFDTIEIRKQNREIVTHTRETHIGIIYRNGDRQFGYCYQ